MSVTDDQIHAALLAFDKDADGRLMPNEVIMSQLSLGIFLPAAERKKFDEKVGEAPLDYATALQLIKSVSSGRQPKAELAKMFANFDMKRDGTISAAELKAVLENLGELLSGPQIEEITAKFAANDRIKYSDLIDYLLD